MIDFIRKGKDTSDATATVNDIISSKTAYVNNEKITGNMPDNGQLNYGFSTSQQTIPEGYTNGGTIAAYPQSQEDYDNCLIISHQVLGSYYNNYIPTEVLHINSSKKIDLGIKVNLSYTYKLKFKDNSVSPYEAYIGTTASNTFLCRYNSSNNLNTSNMTSNIYRVPTNPTEATLKFRSSAGNNIWLGSTGQSTADNADYDIYYLEVYDSENNLVNNFIPVINTIDDSVGLVDTVNSRIIVY